MSLIGFLGCGNKSIPVPYDRMTYTIDEAYSHPDKAKMEAHYKSYIDELYEKLQMAKEKCQLKKEE